MHLSSIFRLVLFNLEVVFFPLVENSLPQEPIAFMATIALTYSSFVHSHCEIHLIADSTSVY